MNFISIAFVVFFVVVTVAYYLCPARWRWLLLLIASCYFYMAWVPKYILILFALILIDYILAFQIEKSAGKKRKTFLLISVISNIGILFVFKYFNFFNANVAELAQLIHWNYSISALTLLLPLGLSFHTFQSLSYVIEVYRGKWKPERHLGIYALYVLFFPQLVAGPIERPYHLLPQLKKTVYYEWENIISGLRLMGWGFFQKIVIADRLAISVDYIYGNIGHVPGLSIVFAFVFFAFQLYADFAGYSNIARGSARVLGIDIIRNFDRPYFSKSIAEFWRRWHISLSTWFRDYLYYPMVYSAKRLSRGWLYFSLIVTFVVMGLWHGAGWTFIIMGALFGVYIVIGLITKPWRDRFLSWSGLGNWPTAHSSLQVLGTFFLASFAWIFFRAPNLRTALAFIANAFTGWNLSLASVVTNYIQVPFTALGFSRGDLILSFGGIFVLLLAEYIESREALGLFLNRQPLWIRSSIYSSLILSLIVFGAYTNKQFIYFQF